MSLTLEKYKELEKESGNCIMEVDGMCHSDYNYGCKCDGKNIPDSCPYNKLSSKTQKEKGK